MKGAIVLFCLAAIGSIFAAVYIVVRYLPYRAAINAAYKKTVSGKMMTLIAITTTSLIYGILMMVLLMRRIQMTGEEPSILMMAGLGFLLLIGAVFQALIVGGNMEKVVMNADESLFGRLICKLAMVETIQIIALLIFLLWISK